MKTNVISIKSDLSGKTDAIEEAERFTNYYGLTGKDAMHIRLLTEESISMVDGIIKGFKGNFWLESKKTKTGLLCRICVSADVSVNEEQEDQLLDIATSGENEESKGILGKIRQFFRWSIQQTDQEAYAQSSVYMMGVQDASYWSLQQYTQNIQKQHPNSEEWDELEKSIIAKLADEVKIGIRSERAIVIIEKYITPKI